MLTKNLLLVAATFVAASSLSAANRTATGTELNTGAAWSTGTVPGSTEDAIWTTGSAMGAQTVTGAVNWKTLTFDTNTPAGTVDLSGSAITLAGGSVGGTTNVITTGLARNITIANDLVLSGVVSNSAILVGNNGARLQLNADFGGNLTLGNVTANGGATANDANLFLRGSATNSIINGTLTVDGQLGKADTGTWTLNGANTIGWVVINKGTLLAGTNSSFGTGTIYFTSSGDDTATLASTGSAARSYANGIDFTATLDAAGGSTNSGFTNIANFGQTSGGTGAQSFAGNVNLGTAGNRQIKTNSDTTFSGIVSGVGAGITKSGTAKLILTGANTYTGTTTVNAGTLAFGAPGASGPGVTSISQGNFVVNNTGTLQFVAPVNGSTFATATGAGTGVTVNAGGTLNLYQYNGGTSTVTWILPTLTLNGGTLSTTAGNGTVTNNIDANITLGAATASTITANSGGYNTNINLGGVISGSGSVTFNTNLNGNANGGVISLTGANTYTGTTTIAASNASSARPVVQLGNGGTTGSLSASSAISVGAGANFGVNRSNTVTQGTDFSAAGITGAGGFIQSGTGTTILNAANTYTGGTLITKGKLLTGNISALGSGAGTVAVTGAGTTLQIGAGGVTLGAGAALTIASGSILKFTDGTSIITLTNGYTLTGSAIIDLNGGFAGSLNQQYNLISGAGTKNDGSVLVQNGASGYSYSFSQGVLTVSAVPEPSTYGLIGAGALAAAAIVRRRKRTRQA